ncbi:DUF6082 family protein [Streptomyces sp. NPDC054766]
MHWRATTGTRGWQKQQRFQTYLLNKALNDPDLAEVLSTIDEVGPTRRRQYLFVNAICTNTLRAYRAGDVSWDELPGHLRVICQSAIFRDYWDTTHHHRASLETASQEAAVGRIVDTTLPRPGRIRHGRVVGRPRNRANIRPNKCS